MFIRTLTDGVYRADVHIVIGPFDKYKVWLNKETGCETRERQPQARVTRWQRDDGVVEWFVWIPETWSAPLEHWQQRTLLHETRHLSDQIMRDRGVEWTDESEEAFAYHQEFWYDTLVRVVEAYDRKRKITDARMRAVSDEVSPVVCG